MRLVVVSIIGLLAACNTPPEQEARDLCTALCNCMTASPTLRDECVAECIPDVPAMLPDDCINCIYQYSQSCSDLEAHCEAACDVQQPPMPQPNL